MAMYEFEGRTEKEAIDRAAAELGLEKDAFDVEIIESQGGFFPFKKSYVKIRIHTNDQSNQAARVHTQPNQTAVEPAKNETKQGKRTPFNDAAQNSFEQELIQFLDGLITHMGYRGTLSIQFREDHKLGIKIDSENSSILIGKKGKTLDALQLLVNIYAERLGKDNLRIILDSENYRLRREESLVRLAYTVADRVRETHRSILLEPMNPFDRRLIHTTLNDIADVETKSEGEGVYKQVRVFYKGGKY